MQGNTLSLVRRLLAPALLLTAVSLAVPMTLRAQDEAKPADGKEYTWTFKHKKGDKYRMKAKAALKLTLSGNDIPIEALSTTKHEVKEVADNGDVTTVETSESSKVSYLGMDIENAEPDRKVTEVVNKTGVVIKRTIENSQQADAALEKLSFIGASFPTPPKPVKIGDTWKTEINNPLVEGKKVTVTSKLTGKEKIKDVETLVVKVEVAVPPSAEATEKDHVKMITTYYVNPQEGRLVRVKGSIENAPFDVQGMTGIIGGEQEADILPGEKDEEKK